jgi:hypothetical protein
VFILAWFVSRWQVEVKAILRTTPVLLGLFSIVTLWAHDLSKSRKLKPRIAVWYPKAELTFSDAIAAVRREIWGHQISFMSRPRRDRIEIPAKFGAECKMPSPTPLKSAHDDGQDADN